MTLVKTNTLLGPGDWVYNAWQQLQEIPGYNNLPVNNNQGIDWNKLLMDYWYIPVIVLMAIILLKK